MVSILRAGRRRVIDPRAVHSRRHPHRLVSLHVNFGVAFDVRRHHVAEDAMRKHAYSDQEHTRDDRELTEATAPVGALPNRLLTTFEVARFIGCHEETVRRAYWRGLLTSQRFGVRGRRFHPADVLDWISRGAPTRRS